MRSERSWVKRALACLTAAALLCAAPVMAAPSLSVSSDSVYVGDTVTVEFSGDVDAGSGVTALYDVDFGDGSKGHATGTDGSTTHKYMRNGTFTVTLTVVDQDGTSGTVTEDVAVTANPAAPTPKIDSPAPAATSNFGSDVAFDGYASDGTQTGVDSYASQYTYMWDYNGDGRVDDTVTSASSAYDSNTNHVSGRYLYEQPGEYRAYFYVKNQAGVIGVASVKHTVTANDPVSFNTTVNPTAGEYPLPTTFTVNVTDANGQTPVVQVDFDGNGFFDDSATGTNPTFMHSYAAPGVYTPRVRVFETVTPAGTASDTDSVTVRVPKDAQGNTVLTIGVTDPDMNDTVGGSAVPLRATLSTLSDVDTVAFYGSTTPTGSATMITETISSVTTANDGRAIVNATWDAQSDIGGNFAAGPLYIYAQATESDGSTVLSDSASNQGQRIMVTLADVAAEIAAISGAMPADGDANTASEQQAVLAALEAAAPPMNVMFKMGSGFVGKIMLGETVVFGDNPSYELTVPVMLDDEDGDEAQAWVYVLLNPASTVSSLDETSTSPLNASGYGSEDLIRHMFDIELYTDKDMDGDGAADLDDPVRLITTSEGLNFHIEGLSTVNDAFSWNEGTASWELVASESGSIEFAPKNMGSQGLLAQGEAQDDVDYDDDDGFCTFMGANPATWRGVMGVLMPVLLVLAALMVLRRRRTA